MGTKDATERIRRVLNGRLDDGVTKDCVFEDIKYIDNKLERGEKFEKMWRRLNEDAINGVYDFGTSMGRRIREDMVKLEAEFFGSSPSTVVVEIGKIDEIINMVDRMTIGMNVWPSQIVNKLKGLFPKNKEDC